LGEVPTFFFLYSSDETLKPPEHPAAPQLTEKPKIQKKKNDCNLGKNSKKFFRDMRFEKKSCNF
jgi:hypothetical protein